MRAFFIFFVNLCVIIALDVTNGIPKDEQTTEKFLKTIMELGPYHSLLVLGNEVNYDYSTDTSPRNTPVYHLPEYFSSGRFLDVHADDSESFMCPVEEPDDVILATEISKYYYGVEYCLVKKNFQHGEKKACKKEIKPLLVANEEEKSFFTEQENDKRLCGPNNSMNGLKFVFPNCGNKARLEKIVNAWHEQLPQKTNEAFPISIPLLEMYELCFDFEKEETYYTHHFIRPSLIANENILRKTATGYQGIPTDLSREIALEYLDSIHDHTPFTHIKLAKFIKMKHTLKNQLDSPDRMVEQMLVPLEDMPFPLWKKAAKSYFNVSLLNVQLVPLMKLINERIRSYAIKSNHKLSVYTAVFHMLMKDYKPRYLHNEKDLRIPTIWSKLVYDVEIKKTTLILIHNTLGMTAESNKICDFIVRCNFENWMNDLDMQEITKQQIRETKDYAYCCDATDVMLNFYGIQITTTGVIEDMRYDEGDTTNTNL